MISCIICSRRSDISAELKENIASTIGYEYELVVIDNSKNEYSIFSAYNEGVRRAKGDILCFMHEDILYHTQGWGGIVAEYFVQYPQAGLIGVAGTHYMPAMPAAQWDCELSSSSMIQGEFINGEYVTTTHLHDEYKANPTNVVAVDGLWMCMPRKMFDKVYWDDNSFKGFHCYDTDMGFQVWNAGLEVHVCWDVLIEHKSLGVTNKSFVASCSLLYNKWKNLLPMVRGVELNKSEIKLSDALCESKILYRQLELSYKSVITSKAYQFGKHILKPVSDVKKMLKKINGGG